MNKIERTIQLSASICSLLAFIVLIYEKTGIIKLSIEHIIMYVLFGIYVLLFTSLSILASQKYYEDIVKETENPFGKLSLILLFAFFLILLYAILIGIAWTFITSIQF